MKEIKKKKLNDKRIEKALIDFYKKCGMYVDQYQGTPKIEMLRNIEQKLDFYLEMRSFIQNKPTTKKLLDDEEKLLDK